MDIVERLRGWLLDDPKWGKGVDLSIDYDDVKKAADEIERLLQQVEDLALVARGAAHRIENTKKSHRFLAMIDKVVGGER